MKKSFLITFLAVVLAVCACGTIACGTPENNNGKSGLLYKKYQGDEYYTVYGYVSEEGVTTLDLGEYNKNGVTIGRIQEGAFDGNESLKEIIVPTTVETIDAGAFAGIRSLEKITLPFIGNTVLSDPMYGHSPSDEKKSVDVERTFGYVFGTEEFKFGVKVTQKYNGSSEQVYYVPSGLKEITISPKENYNIPMFAFSGNNIITKVNFNEKVIGIGENAFENCDRLSEVTGRSSVQIIYKNAFYGCKALKDMSGFSALLEVCESAFEGSGLTTVVLEETVKYGKCAFKNSAVETVEIKNQTVPYGAFYGCKNLTQIALNKDNVNICDYAIAYLNETKTCTLTTNGHSYTKGNNADVKSNINII